MHRSFTLIGILSTWISVLPAHAEDHGIANTVAVSRPYYLEIDKSERLLRVKFAGETYREYHIASGRGGSGAKRQLGDKRTPEGIYRIVDINASSEFHLFLRLNYPNVNDAFTGLKNSIISNAEFNRIIESLIFGKLPPQDTALGGAIGIHGVGVETADKLKIHSNLDWTKGCVALTNDEVSELRQLVSIGTEVVIQE